MRGTRLTFHSSTVTAQSSDLLKPVVRAYVFGHLSTTGPRLLSILLSLRTKWRHYPELLSKTWDILLRSLSVNAFPSFCATLVGSYGVLQVPLLAVVEALRRELLKKGLAVRPSFSVRTSRYLAAFVAAWFSLPLLNRSAKTKAQAHKYGVSNGGDSASSETVSQSTSRGPSASFQLAGRSLDLTILAVVRALESLIRQAYLSHSALRVSAPSAPSRLSALIPRLGSLTDATVFATSTAIIMWAWIYAPERLPRGYSRWIDSAAKLDRRLITVLRAARRGEWVYSTPNTSNHYNQPPDQAKILSGMCDDYGFPPEWADPAKTCPLPCDLVHMGLTPSCYKHSALRFGRALRFSFAMYLPLQLLVKSRRMVVRGISARARLLILLTAVREAGRSSAFLGAFIALFWTGVCTTRTLLGPRLLNRQLTTIKPATANADENRVRTQQMLDSGLCIGAGCVACGWSILIERPRRRVDLAMFVAPRAASTVLPRRYGAEMFWRERLAFALATGALFAMVSEDPAMVRGVLGQVLGGVLRA